MARYLCWPPDEARLRRALAGWLHPHSRAALPLMMEVGGIPCRLQELAGADPERIRAAYGELSEQSVYLRFMRAKQLPSDEQLAFFLDYFELAFIIIPLLAPVADALGIDLIWFGVMLAVNMQTSFMHPPFGFSLFFLRSVAPEKVKTTSIYWGAVPFVIIQLIMVGLIIAFPGLVSYGDGGKKPSPQQELNLEQLLPGGAGAPAQEDPGALMRRLQGQ